MSSAISFPIRAPFRFHLTALPDLLLDREWMLPSPATQIHTISLSPQLPPHHSLSYSIKEASSSTPSFHIVRDDLLHPLSNGNKARKLDALLPLLRRHSTTDLVTCGGCQSAHAAAVAVCCAERGMRSHLLLRGERPEIPTGYNLISSMFGDVKYVARSAYSRRDEMLREHAEAIAGTGGSVVEVDEILREEFDRRKLEDADGGLRRVVIVNEGAASVVALLGVIRLVRYLSDNTLFGKEQQIQVVLDAGTGTTAVGLALGIICLGLPWKVTAVMLADTLERYKEREKCLISDLKRTYQIDFGDLMPGEDDGIVQWVERFHARKFGRVLNGEIELCRQIAHQTGILLDPIYTLAAWEHAASLSLSKEAEDGKVVMLHTGGTLGMFGLAQRYTGYFNT
ncbi:putative D-cysteine desulfhydrase 2, mitochondrial [Typha latifolia]|uniref:putative D-cysteine desulfhydrase 2, mitochondrial n=1 Tax=Typha latifolia TaxID=4733 RepID=UPI003C2EE8B6